MFLAIVLLAVFTVFTSTSPVVELKVETNAQRLARGLPPLLPKFRTARPGFIYDIFHPTPAYAAKRSLPSSRPSQTVGGSIQVRLTNGDFVGNLLLAESTPGVFTVNTINSGDPSQNLAVSTTLHSGSSSQLDLQITNIRSGVKNTFLGLQSVSSTSIGPDSSSFLVLANVMQTNPDDPPEPDNGKYEESAIWVVDGLHNNKLSVRYVNPDLSVQKVKFAYRTDSREVFAVGDLSAWKSKNLGVSVSKVELYIV